MSTDHPPDAGAFADSLGRLEAQIAAADASGDPIPPEARQMAAKLRELVDALKALTADSAPAQPDSAPTTDASENH